MTSDTAAAVSIVRVLHTAAPLMLDSGICEPLEW